MLRVKKAAEVCLIFVTVAILALAASTPAADQQDPPEERYDEPHRESRREQAADLSGRVVIIDAGHGADSTNVYAGYDEQAAMLALALKVKPLLEERGATVRMTRAGEENVPLYVRAAMVNKWALEAVRDARLLELSEFPEWERPGALMDDIAELDRLLAIIQSVIDDPETNAPVYMNAPYDYTYKRKIHPDWQRVFEYQEDPAVRERFLFISLHSNATGKPIDTSVNGADVFYASNTYRRNMRYYDAYSGEDRSVRFGGLLLDNIDALGIRRRGINPTNLLMVREHNVPGVLAENGFHTNAGDREKLSDDAFLDALALAYADAVTRYFMEDHPGESGGSWEHTPQDGYAVPWKPLREHISKDM